MRPPRLLIDVGAGGDSIVYSVNVPDEWARSRRFWRLSLLWLLIRLMWKYRRPR